MAIRGSLREASLPDVLQLLAMGKKTGCLSVTHRQHFGTVYFDRGRISYATIVNRRDRLGDLLVMHGLISRADLDAAVRQQAAHPERRLGEILVASGMIPREQVHEYIRHQIEEAVYFLFTWTQGSFTFEPDVRPDAQDVLVSISPESLLLEGARRVDEWTLIQKKIPSLDLIFTVDREHLTASDARLTTEQETLVPLLDGRRDVNALVEDSGLDEFEVGKALYGLVTAGFVRRAGKSRGPDTIATEARIGEHRNLGLAFYKTGMYDEALREFRRVLELRPRDGLAEFFVGLVALRQDRVDDACRMFRACAASPESPPAVQLNLAYALERAGRYEEARIALGAAERKRPDDPVVRLAQAVLALRAGDMAAADTRLQECSALYGSRVRPAAWFHYAGLVAALRGDLDRAIGVLEEGIGTHPHAAVLHNNLAVVRERRGHYAEAATAAERGSLEDPTQAQLHKNIGDLLYRAARYDEALEAYQRAVRCQPELGGDVYLKMGNIRFRRRETEEAVRCWERSLALAPDNPMARNNLDAARRLA
jgi:tetratricopeptide (TPR) repeat protein